MDSSNRDITLTERIQEKNMTKIASRSSLDTTISNEGGNKYKSGHNSPRKISIDDYNIIRSIGKGSYAKVILARNNKTLINYAIKVIKKEFIEKEDKVDQIHIERQILSKLSHPNVIKLYNTFHDSKKLYYVFEYADKGDLKEYLDIHGIPSYNLSRFIIAEIINALEYLHMNGVIHRDLKPENIVLNEKFHIKLIDFATAAYYGKYFDLKEKEFKVKEKSCYDNCTLLGTAEYISPEMINENTCGFEGDLWALGCIVYQLFHNSVPFSGSNNIVKMKNIIENKMNPINNSLPEDVKDLIMKLLVQDPNKRLGANRNFEVLKSHNFFRDIKFDSLSSMDAPIKQVKKRNIVKQSLSSELIFAFQTEDEDEDEIYCKTQRTYDSRSNLFRSSVLPTRPSNLVLYEDLVKKKSPWLHFNKRRLLLFNNRLDYIDPLTNKKKGDILLNRFCLALLKDNYTFEIFTPKRTYVFKTESEGSANVWCDRINLVIEYLKKD